MRRLAVLVLCVIGIVGATLGPAAVVGAHSIVQRAEPAPGETVPGPVEQIALRFVGTVLEDVTVTVRAPDGTPVPASAPVEVTDGGTSAVAAFAPMSAPGAYEVRYAFVSADGHPIEDGYRFTIAPPARQVDGEGADVRTPLVALGAVGAVGIALIARSSQRNGAPTGGS